ncbi:class I SAM-dependent methyltransferase [Mucilaginibacter ginsenosidivorans]|uniref:Class I SAM-dependent methyltransferase n=1 Tax=Mucilaginibacter ginsenosidivorans TaxID=398053 RepID=A0A5B8V4K1_9SPHI|nr:class I SAM-dependent methyltransferase [Mucilaginibacter ginsenosidivorans]QEC65516.1 class I SAM-dependent methyltransferase [Mucilaginibacter ginsenosidivorans]
MAANYNNSAWFYDKLSRLIYGNALVKAQVYLLDSIPPGSKILIAGGGTGWILQEIVKIHPGGLSITYVEVAANMMVLSRKRNIGGNRVDFINDAVENVPLANDHDVVLTPFLFDNFTEESLQKIFGHIRQSLKPGGLWLNADFRLTGKWWQKILLRSMIVFFRLICGIEATKLPGIEQCFAKHGYAAIKQKSFFGDFILSTVYQKL